MSIKPIWNAAVPSRVYPNGDPRAILVRNITYYCRVEILITSDFDVHLRLPSGASVARERDWNRYETSRCRPRRCSARLPSWHWPRSGRPRLCHWSSTKSRRRVSRHRHRAFALTIFGNKICPYVFSFFPTRERKVSREVTAGDRGLNHRTI